MEKVQRTSNIELLRIVLMFMIVLHHYCVNSGLTDLMQWDHVTSNTVLVQLMAIGGKIGVNGFFLISGYFMINKIASWRKVIKLVAEVLFYNIVVLVFLTSMGQSYTSFDLLKCFIPWIFTMDTSFLGCYVLIYMLSPVWNKCLKSLTKKEFSYFLLVMIFYFSILSTLHINMQTWNYFIWGLVVYSIGAYMRLFDIKARQLPWGWLSMASLLFVWGGILFVDFWPVSLMGGERLFNKWTFFFTDANKLPVLVMAVALFMLILRRPMPYNKYINRVAASCLGVLMIHANSFPMIHWLWRELLGNVNYYSSSLLWLHMFGSVIAIYIVCTLIDMIRIKYIETPFFTKLLKW